MTQRIFYFSPVFRTSAARSQLTLCSTLKLQRNDQAVKVRVTLQEDYITLLVVNKSQNLGFSSLLHIILTHFKDKFDEYGFATSLKHSAFFFNSVPGYKLPDENGQGYPNSSSHDAILWREFTSIVLSGEHSTTPKLVAARLTFGSNTIFSAEGAEHQTSFFKSSWPANKEISLRASFKPGNPDQSSGKGASLEQQLESLWNDISQFPHSHNAVKAISLLHLHPNLCGSKPEDVPSWLPRQRDALEMNVRKDPIVFKTTFSAPEAKTPTTELKGLELILSGVKLLADLSNILDNVRFSTDEMSVDLLGTRTTDSSDSYYLFWSITLRIGHVSISFVQL